MKIKNGIPKILAGFIIFVAVTGCDDVISADVNDEFFIRPGQKAEIRESGLEITFNKVIEDSRCPKGVECVWAGNAKIELTISFPGKEPEIEELNTGLDPKEIMTEGYRIVLLELQPYPEINKEILPENYRIKLMVKM